MTLEQAIATAGNLTQLKEVLSAEERTAIRIVLTLAEAELKRREQLYPPAPTQRQILDQSPVEDEEGETHVE